MRERCVCGDPGCPFCGTAQGIYEPRTRKRAFKVTSNRRQKRKMMASVKKRRKEQQ